MADELASARLILPCLLGAVGAPVGFVGFLVPIREVGALLPQLLVAAYIRRLPQRKGVWIIGGMLSAVVLVIMAAVTGTMEGVTGLGLLIIASGLAASLSAPVRGRMGDRSSRRVMIIASAAAGVTGLATGLADSAAPCLMSNHWITALLFLLITVFHSGVRLGRKIYLVDMAAQDTRSAYVAVSNTVIGVAMLFGGAIGLLGDVSRTSSVIAVLGAASLLAAFYIARMEEVSG